MADELFFDITNAGRGTSDMQVALLPGELYI
jgi:hypothetical protein